MFTKPRRLSLTDGIDGYLRECIAAGQSDRTLEGKRCILQRFLKWFENQEWLWVSDLTLERLIKYGEYLHQFRKPNGDPLDRGTRRNHLTVVKGCCRYLHVLGHVKENPAEFLCLPKTPKRIPKRALKQVEVPLVLERTRVHGMKGVRDSVLLSVCYATGIRRMEISALNIGDVDVHDKTVRVNRGKGDKDRMVAVSESVAQAVAYYLKEVRPKLATARSGTALFLDNWGRRYRAHQLSGLASKYLKRSGVSAQGACNVFRHSAATHMLENGADLRFIQAQLGHADISTTQVYTRVAIGKLQEVYEKNHPAARMSLDELLPNRVEGGSQ
ncbi:tyrosine-type recombinase/integrase [Porticoccus sp. GXU_MW_L64]